MKKIDTTKWQEFRVGDLFDLERGSVKKLQILSEGNTPVIAAARTNQGVAGYYEIDAPYKDRITISCNGVGCGSTYYHDYPFNINGDAMVLLEKNPMSELSKRFICCMLDGILTRKYSYVEKCSPQKVSEELILLPTANKSPHWQYIEDFMRNIETHVNTSLEVFQTVTERKKQLLNTSQWKPFRMDALFEVVKGKRLTKSDMKEGNINYIGATAFNNGITAKIANDEYLHAAGTISVCYNGSIGQAFYQEEPYWATDDVNVLYPRFAMTKNVALFIIPILRNIGQRFAYVDKWTQDKMKETEIPLPSTSNGEPDFEYMEQYMKTIEQRVQNTITKIA